MHNRYRISLVALVVLVLGVATQPAAAQDVTPTDTAQQAADAARLAACATPTAPGSPVTISGKGRVQSAPFTLDGGAYTVAWSATEVSGVPSIYLQSATDASVLEQLLKGISKDGKDGQTYIYKMKPGTYYLNVSLPAGWSVTFTPLAV